MKLQFSCYVVSQQGLVKNLSLEHQFNLHEKAPVGRTHSHFSAGFRTKTRFNTEAKGKATKEIDYWNAKTRQPIKFQRLLQSIKSQEYQCDLFTNRTIFCAKQHLYLFCIQNEMKKRFHFCSVFNKPATRYNICTEQNSVKLGD